MSVGRDQSVGPPFGHSEFVAEAIPHVPDLQCASNLALKRPCVSADHAQGHDEGSPRISRGGRRNAWQNSRCGWEV